MLTGLQSNRTGISDPNSVAWLNCCRQCRDQGFTRPKILILLPFRDAALRVVNVMIKLLMSEEEVTYVFKYVCRGRCRLICVIILHVQEHIGHKKRFREEYGHSGEEETFLHKPGIDHVYLLSMDKRKCVFQPLIRTCLLATRMIVSAWEFRSSANF